jgi:hypothetical protein
MKGAKSASLPSLTLWIEGRLASRQAITWVTKAFKGEKGLSTENLIALLQPLATKAIQNNLAPDIGNNWQLLYHAAQEREKRVNWYHVERFKRAIRELKFSPEDVKTLVDFVRPRISPSEPSPFGMAEEGISDDPRRWVHWRFETSSGSVDHGAGRISRRLLSLLSATLLADISNESTSALVAALAIARKAGWMKDRYDLTNSYVARVAFDTPDAAPSLAVNENDDDHDSGDPDAIHDGFAPLLRLMTAAFDALTEKDPNAARKIASLWEERTEELFIRLQAHAGLHPQIWDGAKVGDFLERLSDLVFWRWSAYPEISTLRALRWNDISDQQRENVSARLVRGPQRDDFDPDREVSKDTLLYWRDHEIARVVDNNAKVPGQFLEIVRNRRALDGEFPIQIKAVEIGRTNVSFRPIPDGDAQAFNNVSDEDLIATLARATRDRPFGEGHNAEAYARKNRSKVANLLAQQRNTDDDIVTVWELALSYPHEKLDEVDDARLTAENIAKHALEMDATLFQRISDRLCYWLDATDELLKDFFGGVSLWQRLLPFSVQRENLQAAGDAARESDLTSAALNVPFGHLVSYFFRRCPTMSAQEQRSLPSPFVELLKPLEGRARALLANRMATTANYFWLADRDWYTRFVLDPMLSNTPDGIALWEAFAKFGPVPGALLWHAIEESLISHIAHGRLSKEALRRLAEMTILVWSWTRAVDSEYTVDVSGLRSALGLTSEEVRAAAAWQFVQLLHREGGETKEEGPAEEGTARRWNNLGLGFFSEIWPLEPAVQSGGSANDFARIPSRVGIQYFANAVQTVIPFLRAFEVWDIETDFDLTKSSDGVVRAHPTETLSLIAACVSDDQSHGIYRLGRILSLIVEAKAELGRDPELRRLRRFVVAEDISSSEDD